MSMSKGGDQNEGLDVLTMLAEYDSLTADEAQTWHLSMILSFSIPRDLSHPVKECKESVSVFIVWVNNFTEMKWKMTHDHKEQETREH